MDEFSLFGDEPAATTAPPTNRLRPAERWQTDLIRKALDGAGLLTQGERGARIVELAGRPVAALSELYSDEAALILIALGRTQPSNTGATSLWESREEDTWIDRL